jgi:hypothetical protein
VQGGLLSIVWAEASKRAGAAAVSCWQVLQVWILVLFGRCPKGFVMFDIYTSFEVSTHFCDYTAICAGGMGFALVLRIWTVGRSAF